MVLLADPQLVDPHTYPSRPWPLSTATVKYTDLYLRKSFQFVQDILDPDTTIFLGDLFDGGREWATRGGDISDRQWKNYGDNFWLREYDRFGRIFFKSWIHGTRVKRQGKTARKMIVTLPGNHDLGLGTGIRLPVRKRFNAYFGGGNRVDIIGNHSVVSVDTVSLSAKGQADPTTGQMGSTDGNELTRQIWGPAEDFLSQAKAEKARAIIRELRVQAGKNMNEELDHTVLEIDDPVLRQAKKIGNVASSTDIPSILLTHVPLYRSSGTPCGLLRERYPPTKSDKAPYEPLEKDDRNAIRVEAGIQYQNVLTPSVSNELVDKIGDIEHVFSGDDHDYCEVVHRGFSSRNGGIREITVKSMSWAMGVRKPGFLMVSLWNPLDAEGNRIGGSAKGKTLQSHLCLLPDQLSIFIRYGLFLGFTGLVLFVRALRLTYSSKYDSKEPDTPLLPVVRPIASPPPHEMRSASARSPDPSSHNGLAARSSAARTRSVSPSVGYGLPLPQSNPLSEDKYDVFRDGNARKKNSNDIVPDDRTKRRRGRIWIFFQAFKMSFYQVASVVLLWYTWLLWNR